MCQPDLESFLKIGEKEDRENQEHEKLSHELAKDDKQRHDRVSPVVVSPVARGCERFGCPLDTFEESSRRSLQVLHAKHIDGAEQDHGGRKHCKQCQQALGRTLEFGKHFQRSLKRVGI
jgi:hypothetical protein